jgi:hypothetical protein
MLVVHGEPVLVDAKFVVALDERRAMRRRRGRACSASETGRPAKE